jgi:hypothetical protein
MPIIRPYQVQSATYQAPASLAADAAAQGAQMSQYDPGMLGGIVKGVNEGLSKGIAMQNTMAATENTEARTQAVSLDNQARQATLEEEIANKRIQYQLDTANRQASYVEKANTAAYNDSILSAAQSGNPDAYVKAVTNPRFSESKIAYNATPIIEKTYSMIQDRLSEEQRVQVENSMGLAEARQASRQSDQIWSNARSGKGNQEELNTFLITNNLDRESFRGGKIQNAPDLSGKMNPVFMPAGAKDPSQGIPLGGYGDKTTQQVSQLLRFEQLSGFQPKVYDPNKGQQVQPITSGAPDFKVEPSTKNNIPPEALKSDSPSATLNTSDIYSEDDSLARRFGLTSTEIPEYRSEFQALSQQAQAKILKSDGYDPTYLERTKESVGIRLAQRGYSKLPPVTKKYSIDEPMKKHNERIKSAMSSTRIDSASAGTALAAAASEGLPFREISSPEEFYYYKNKDIYDSTVQSYYDTQIKKAAELVDRPYQKQRGVGETISGLSKNLSE